MLRSTHRTSRDAQPFCPNPAYVILCLDVSLRENRWSPRRLNVVHARLPFVSMVSLSSVSAHTQSSGRDVIESAPPSSQASDAGPTAHTQGSYQGRLIAIKKDFSGVSISSSCAVIRSLCVPLDWEVRAHDFTGYRGLVRVFTSVWSGSGLASRSYRLPRLEQTPQSR